MNDHNSSRRGSNIFEIKSNGSEKNLFATVKMPSESPLHTIHINTRHTATSDFG